MIKKLDEAIEHQDNIINMHKEFNKTWDMILKDMEEKQKQIDIKYRKSIGMSL